MKERQWDRQVLRRLRGAVPGSSTSVVLPSPSLLLTISGVVLLGFCILAGPHLVNGQVSLQAAAGWSGLTWILAGFGIVSVAWNASAERPWVPEILRRAPVDEAFLGRRARRHALSAVRNFLLVSVVMVLFLAGGCGLAEASRHRPWSWSLTIPAAGLLWLHLLGAGVFVLRAFRFAARRIRLPVKLASALFMLSLLAVLGIVLSPVLLDGKGTREWMIGAGAWLAERVPASAFLTWPAGGGVPWIAAALTGAALAAGWPVLRDIARRLRDVPHVAAWTEACWDEDVGMADDEWDEEDEDEEVTALRAAAAPPSAEAPPAVVEDFGTRCREALGRWHDPGARWFQPWTAVPPPARLDRRALAWCLLPSAFFLTLSHPATDLLAWVWLGVSAWGVVPSRPWTWSCRRPIDLPWLPVSPVPAWREFYGRHAAGLRRALLPGVVLAAGGLAAAVPGQLLESLWPWAGERAAWPNAIAPWRCALVVAMMPLLRAWFLWLSAPTVFWCDAVPRQTLAGFLPWRWAGFRLAAAVGTFCGTTAMVGLMAWMLSGTTSLRVVALPLAALLLAGLAARAAAIAFGRRMWAAARRR